MNCVTSNLLSPAAARKLRIGRSMTSKRGGFSLLEIVLAVSLSVIVVGAIGSAIYVNTSVVQRQQVAIEQSLVARNVLLMMANDLRAAFQYKPADVTGLEELTASQNQIAGLAGAAGLGEGQLPEGIDPSLLAGMSGAGAGETGGSSESEEPTEASQNISGNQTAILRPGLYGNSRELMVDISRLPRLDQYSPVVLGTSGPVSLPTDLKTIAWFVQMSSLETDQMILPQTTGTAVQGGLYRRELDRAVAAFNLDVAGALAADGYTQLVASEIVAVEFRYFDGEKFLSYWDSDEMGGFPSAVEITIAVDPQREIRESGAPVQPQDIRPYRTVVYLPIAEILEEEPAAAATTGGGNEE
jgi:hypothetical protein